MGVIIPVGLASAAMHTALDGDPEDFVTTCGFAKDSGPPWTQGEVDTLSGIWSTFFLSYFSVDMTYRGLHLEVGDVGANPVFDSIAGAGNGAGTSGNLPQNNAYLVHKNTGVGGRANKGRFYAPMVGEANVNNAGVLSGATISGFNAFLADLFSDFGLSDFVPMVLHSIAIPPTVITSFTIDPIISTQRRRLRP